MKIETLYLVTDPTLGSTFADVCWECTPEKLCNWAVGGLQAGETFRKLRGAVYTSRAEAEADALARLATMRKRGA